MEIIITILQIIFWFIVILIPLVVIHELGHLLAARLFGVKIPEFGVGLPLSQTRLTKQWKGIKWSFYPWLLGGFVRIYGDHDALDEAYYQYQALENKKDIEKINTIKESYVVSRGSEIIQNNELQDFLELNSLTWNTDWKWFNTTVIKKPNLLEIIKKTTSVALDASVLFSLDSSAFINSLHSGDIITKFSPDNIQSQLKNLSQEERDVLLSKLEEKFTSMRSTFQTLIEWEFDAKVNTKNKSAVKDTFFVKNWIQQSLIIFGGIIFNFASAWLIFLLFFSLFGSIPTTVTTDLKPILNDEITQMKTISDVNRISEGLSIITGKDSFADKVGLKKDDQLMAIGSNDLTNLNKLSDFKDILRNNLNKDVDVKIKRDNSIQTLKIDFSSLDKSDPKLGVMLGYKVVRKPSNIGQALGIASNETLSITKGTFQAIGKLFTADKTAVESVSGPIGVGKVTSDIAGMYGIQGLLYIAANISIALAVFNLLPIPALDGGRFLILTVTKITKKRNKAIEATLIGITMILLLGMAVVVAGKDIWQVFFVR
jgi:membrane-associated protease RseP (regulator of RpoE activity)